MSESGDTIVILSSELISSITEQYFNKTMFKQKVKIVDLKPHGDSGYAFVVAFAIDEKKTNVYSEADIAQAIAHHTVSTNGSRDNKGRFVKNG